MKGKTRWGIRHSKKELGLHGKPAKVEWVDAHWQGGDDIPIQEASELCPVACISYGEILRDDKECLVLADHIIGGDADSTRESLAIPRSDIRRIVYLKEGEQK